MLDSHTSVAFDFAHVIQAESGGPQLRNDPPKTPSQSFTKSREQYRIFCVDGAGHIHKSFEFHARDDAEAIKIGDAWRDHGKAELWCRARKVCAWEARRN